MIIDFTIENFRSIKEKQTFSLIAGSGKKHSGNFFENENYSNLKLLKTSVIYGANASGKTNIIRALHAFRYLILFSSDLKPGDNIKCYDPFLFDDTFSTKPTYFSLNFIGTDNIKYEYSISFNKEEVLSEELKYYPKDYPATLFTRQKTGEVKTGKYFDNKKSVPKQVLKNRLFLSEVGGNSYHEHMNGIYLFFKEKIQVWNLTESFNIHHLERRITQLLSEEQNSNLLKKMSDLVRVADLKVEKISITKRGELDSKVLEGIPDELKEDLIEQYKYKVETVHNYRNKAGDIVTKKIDLNDESHGTKVLYALGGLILEKFQSGGVIIFDELENSLHPILCRFLISLFHNEKVNTKNTQLIFTTHQTELLGERLFRKDQIWLTNKIKFGETEFYSLADFDNVRDDVPLDKWYMSGKFDGLPKIKEIEFALSNG
jgi:AAA15 family ATPase/GTPase